MLPSNPENLEHLDSVALKEQNIERVIAIGGDGTVNAVASKLLYSEIAFGIIPMGSGNGLARSLNIPFSFEKALKLIKSGNTRTIDAGTLNRKYFFSTAGVGFDAWVAAAYNKRKSRIRGLIPYYTCALKSFFNFRPFKTNLHYVKKNDRRPLFMITFANTPQFGGGAVIAPSADPGDGKIDLCIVRRPTFFKGLQQAQKLFTSKIHKTDLVDIFKIESCTFETSIPLPFHVDGEPFQPVKDFDVSIIPDALKIIVPRKSK
jgi:YegS/Rv2252/BmrU family lipid kinase